ncbi:peroxisome assembly factor 2-like isoform X2 [Anneissia japonica]|uniref:peroxisome assembly factor 2-like isoform X2 n=1 Tax=Anneissia japonica TaxID=1529436 RepID=UPI0014255F61|nr:peroxisome assembly factor 2-like isoform X2 [Anneissia japonica]
MAELPVKRPGEALGRFSRFNFSIESNPLHVGIARSAAVNILGERQDNYVILSLVWKLDCKSCSHRSRQTADGRELFVCAKVLDDSVVNKGISIAQVSESFIGVVLYSSEFFHRHYSILDSEHVHIRPVQAFPLTKVVFGAKTPQCYEWAKKRLFSTGLLVSVCQQKVLVRSGDAFLAPIIPVFSNDDSYRLSNYFDIVTLECEPVQQGIISLNTSIIITQMKDILVEADETHQNEDYSWQQDPSISLDWSSEDVNSIAPLISEFAKVIDNVSIENKEKEATHNLRLVWTNLIPKASTHRLMLAEAAQGCQSSICESVYKVGATVQTLAKLQTFSGSWIKISRSFQQTTSKENCPGEGESQAEDKTIETNYHLAQLLAINGFSSLGKGTLERNPNPEDCLVPEDDVLYISPLLWNNVQHHPTLLLQPDAMLSVQVATSCDLVVNESLNIGSRSLACNTNPPFAWAIHLALVKSPGYPAVAQFDNIVKKHFEEPRLVTLGDVICMSSINFPEHYQDITEDCSNRSPVIYYKVSKIDARHTKATSYLADSAHTSIFQVTAVNSYIPVTMDAYFSCKLDPIWFTPVPAGLLHNVEHLERLIFPYLIPRSQCNKLVPTFLLTGPVGSGKSTVIGAVCRRLNMHEHMINCHDLCGDSSAATEARIKNVFVKASSFAPCVIQLRNLQVLARDRDGTGEDTRVAAFLKETLSTLQESCPDWPMVVIATAPSSQSIVADLQSSFVHTVKIDTPKEQERLEILHALCSRIGIASDVDVPHLAQRTAGMVLGDLASLLSHTTRAALHRITSSCSVGSKLSMREENDLCTAGFKIHGVDFEKALDQLQSAHSDAIGAPKIPNICWEDVGGLANVKEEILDTVQLPLQHPELFAAGLRRSGILLYGPPGTGKTLLAKAVATECSLNFLSVKGPELINMYVGQSEENVREVFSRARSATPCVIFFDELDSLAPNRGRSGDSGGVMDRVVSQLLAELDGLHKSTDVFVIGATNRPDLLDPALLRPGRFDKLVYLGVSEDRSSQLKILQALTRKFNLSTDLSLESLTSQCPFNMTGADFYALCSDAMLNAIKRIISNIEEGADESTNDVVVQEEDFEAALQVLTPSVSDAELQHYKQIQYQFKKV